jgi:APA family basic amino acid/polyamine antiporter
MITTASITQLFKIVHSLLPVLVSVLAATILTIATNAGLMGISRLSFSMSRYELIPPGLSRIHSRFKTPYPSIVLFGLLAIVMMSPGFGWPGIFENLGGLYAFGSMLAFSFAHLAIIGLRIRKPKESRPFKLRGNFRIGGREIPITAVLGLLGTLSIWVVIIISQPISRFIGFAWLFGGIAMYFSYRGRWKKKPENKNVAYPDISTYNERLP